jgi:hypothetical protein
MFVVKIIEPGTRHKCSSDTGPLPRTHILEGLQKTYGLSSKNANKSMELALNEGLKNRRLKVLGRKGLPSQYWKGSERYKISDGVAKKAKEKAKKTKPAPKEKDEAGAARLSQTSTISRLVRFLARSIILPDGLRTGYFGLRIFGQNYPQYVLPPFGQLQFFKGIYLRLQQPMSSMFEFMLLNLIKCMRPCQ